MERIEREIRHGKEIVDSAEFYWGWGSPAGQERLKRRVGYLTEFGGLRKGVVALELGCGKGLYTRELEKSGATIAPIDISWDLLRAAKTSGSVSGYHVGDAHRMPFRDETFDTIVGVSVLHHMELEPVLRECRRVLRPGGRFVFSEPNMLNPQILIQKNIPFVKRLLGDSPDETAFFKSGIRRSLEAAEYRIVKIIPFDFLHPWVPRPLIGMVDAIGRVVEGIPVLRNIAGSLLIVAERA